MSGSLDGSCVLPAAGKDWHFKLTIGQWMKLQKAFGNIGPTRISERFSSQDWTIENVREVIERGLEGGGLAAGEVGAIATTIVDGQPLNKSYELACDISAPAGRGMDELLKKKAVIEATTQALSRIQMGSGDSAISSAPASSSKSSHRKSSSSVSGNISP